MTRGEIVHSMKCGPIPSTYHAKLCLFIHPPCNQVLRVELQWSTLTLFLHFSAVVPSEDDKFLGQFGRKKCCRGRQWPVSDGGASQQKSHLEFSTATLPSFGQTVYSPCKIPGILHLQSHGEVLRQLHTKVCVGFILLLQVQ